MNEGTKPKRECESNRGPFFSRSRLEDFQYQVNKSYVADRKSVGESFML